MTKPWFTQKVENAGDQYEFTALYNAAGGYIGRINDKDKANEIIHCVNTHDALVGALEKMIDAYEWFCKQGRLSPDLFDDYNNAKAALAAAKGDK